MSKRKRSVVTRSSKKPKIDVQELYNYADKTYYDRKYRECLISSMSFLDNYKEMHRKMYYTCVRFIRDIIYNGRISERIVCTLLKDEIEKGNLTAKWSLGLFYGRVFHNNNEKAKQWYKKSAEDNNPIGQYFLGQEYLYESNNKKALELFTQSAQQSFRDGLISLGRMYHNGTGVEKDIEKTVTFYQKAITLFWDSEGEGYHDVHASLGQIYEIRGDYKKAIKMYEIGYKDPWDYNKAGDNLQRLYKEGEVDYRDPEVQYKLGMMYLKNMYVNDNHEKDVKKGIRWVILSANNGHLKAKKRLNENNFSYHPTLTQYVEAQREIMKLKCENIVRRTVDIPEDLINLISEY